MNINTEGNTVVNTDFTNKIYLTEGIEIRPTSHFMQRWNQRLDNRSPEHFNEAIENKKVKFMCEGTDNSFHFLYRDQYNKFFVFIVGESGGIKTIIPTQYYQTMRNAVNLSPHLEAFTTRDKQIESEVVYTKPDANSIEIEEYKKKITADANQMTRLRNKIANLERMQKDYDSTYAKSVTKFKKRIEKATLKSDDVIVKVLSRDGIRRRTMFTNKECIFYTVLAIVYIECLLTAMFKCY